MNLNDLMKRYDWLDISFIKLSTAAAALLAAKIWPGLLSLEWYWYVVIIIVFAFRPLRRTCLALTNSK